MYHSFILFFCVNYDVCTFSDHGRDRLFYPHLYLIYLLYGMVSENLEET